jgi:hypothetical protein
MKNVSETERISENGHGINEPVKKLNPIDIKIIRIASFPESALLPTPDSNCN